MLILCQNSGSMFGKRVNLYKICTIELRKSKLRKKQKKTRHSRLYATFSIVLLFYLRIIGVNWQWTLTLCGMKLKPAPVFVLVKWSWLVILSTWSRDFVSERFLAGKLHTSYVMEVMTSYMIFFCWGCMFQLYTLYRKWGYGWGGEGVGTLFLPFTNYLYN